MLRLLFLIFGSGFCALVYQVAWQREFRLIFGASTAASAAVVAIFIAGLGIGSRWLGKRADHSPNPLAFYARLEAGIAMSTAVSPLLLAIVRRIYVALGGSVSLGTLGSAIVRLILAALVLALPTILMGGTLPALARAAETEADGPRNRVALLYGVNTLGAVLGSMMSTFVLFEIYGTKKTLWLACLVNLIIAVAARGLSRKLPAPSTPEIDATERPEIAISRLVLIAAAIVGFSFFLMELVWYRMLGPLLGGTVFTFGLILSVALAGIGLGGALYPRMIRAQKATLSTLATTCLLEAVAVAVPLALGDRIALLTLLLQPLGIAGFLGKVVVWTIIAGIVIFPAAFISGVQFPLMIALLGRGRAAVGRHIGTLYAWNTAGAIAGSIAGGFGLLPLLSAPGCWRLVAMTLLVLGLVTAIINVRERGRSFGLPVAFALTVLALLQATGPTAVWRHSLIGVGRAPIDRLRSANAIRDWINALRRTNAWEADGVESSLSINDGKSLSFLVNGKVDGNALSDAGTQILTGLMGAFLHPHMRRALVVGLGTGTTAGWLAKVPSAEHVDVVELEPAVLEMARRCAAVNYDVLQNPKVRTIIGDAREVLLTASDNYDLIASEPSNPYRAGIASLYTQEFFEAARDRLTPGGLFLQWMQTYEVDAETLKSEYATIATVFTHVETWETQPGDLLLVASMAPIPHDVALLKKRVLTEPFKSSLIVTSRTEGVEGLLAHFIARDSFARAIAQGEATVNTDDENSMEFGFARSIAVKQTMNNMDDIIALARARREDRLEDGASEIDWTAVDAERATIASPLVKSKPLDLVKGDAAKERIFALERLYKGDMRGAALLWRSRPRTVVSPKDLELEIASDVERASEEAVPFIDRLGSIEPTEALLWMGALRLRQGKLEEAAESLEKGFLRAREDPWTSPYMLAFGFGLTMDIARSDKTLGVRLYHALERTFAVSAEESDRRTHLRDLSMLLDSDDLCAGAYAAFEPNVPWNEAHLRGRLDCYRRHAHPLSEKAGRDLEDYLAHEPARFTP